MLICDRNSFEKEQGQANNSYGMLCVTRSSISESNVPFIKLIEPKPIQRLGFPYASDTVE